MERKNNNETSGGDSSHFLHQRHKKKIYSNNIFTRDVSHKLKSGPSFAQVLQKSKNLKQPQTSAEAQEREEEEELERVFRAEEKLLQNYLRSRDPFQQDTIWAQLLIL